MNQSESVMPVDADGDPLSDAQQALQQQAIEQGVVLQWHHKFVWANDICVAYSNHGFDPLAAGRHALSLAVA